MRVKSTLLSPSCSKPYCTACPVPWGNAVPRAVTCGCPSRERSGHQRHTGYLHDESEVPLHRICSAGEHHHPAADPLAWHRRSPSFLLPSPLCVTAGKWSVLNPGVAQLAAVLQFICECLWVFQSVGKESSSSRSTEHTLSPCPPPAVRASSSTVWEAQEN